MKKNGFTLLELSVVLLIMGLLLYGGLEGSTYFLKQNHIKATITKLQTIQNAIDIYIVENGYLPCPTTLKNNNGTAEQLCDLSNSNDIFYSNNVARGGIPYKDLNLSPDISYDAWGNKITYSVLLSATRDFKKIKNDYFGISIYNDNMNNKFTDKAIYTIVSHGFNRLGAYNYKKNTQNSVKNITSEEEINIPSNPSDKNIYFINLNNNNDDLLKYKTRMQIIIDNNIENIDCYIDNSLMVNQIIYYDTTVNDSNINNKYDYILPSSNYLLYNQKIDLKTKNTENIEYTFKCFKYGRLGIIKN